jgi:hypothetical protein
MKRDREGLILHLFVTLYEERQETWLQVECGVLIGSCNGSHDIAKAWETPTCPACKVVWDKHQPRPRKWHDGVDPGELLLEAYRVLQEAFPQGTYEATLDGLARAARDVRLSKVEG